MYDIRPNIIIGFHGCDISVRDKLLNHPDHIEISKKPYDWLGNGLYFWENNLERAWEWANDKAAKKEIKTPAVIGAVIQLGQCCDFLNSKFTRIVKIYYEAMKEEYSRTGKQLPVNLDAKGDAHQDKLIRTLDCATIEFMSKNILEQYKKEMASKGFSETKVFDSVRGAFSEGGPAFDGSGIFIKSHIQICIRNMNCIKGFFIPREEVIFPNWFKS